MPDAGLGLADRHLWSGVHMVIATTGIEQTMGGMSAVRTWRQATGVPMDTKTPTS
jgi:phosphoribosylcarboxyaminoimidazole (NCAIR) mutase